MAKFRIEKDFLGGVKIPAEAYYGAETQRSMNNYDISGQSIPATFIRHYAMIKRSAALANMKLGKLNERKGRAIVRACDEIIKGKLAEQFNIDYFQSGAGTSVNMNLNEVIANRALEIIGSKKGDYRVIHPNDDVNMSQSTNDTYHACMHLTVYSELTEALLPALESLQKALDKKAHEFSNVVKTGRTHLQDAVPITLGQEFSGYASSVGRQIKNIKNSSDKLLDISLGGTAVGTGIEASKGYSYAVAGELRKYTKYRFRLARNFFDIQQNQDEEGWVSSSLRDLAVALNKISNDLRLMNSGPASGFGDITLPAVQPGSSIMPGKVNPSMAEMLNMVCFQVIGMDTTVSYCAESGQLELNVYMPLIAYDLLYSIRILSNAVNTFTTRCVAGIKANRERMGRNVSMDMSLATALAPFIGYERAAKIARKALKEGKSVKEVCMELKIMPERDLNRILNPRKLTRRK